MTKNELVDKLLSLGSTISKASLLKMDKSSLEGLLATQEQLNNMQQQVSELLSSKKDQKNEDTEKVQDGKAVPTPSENSFTSIFANQMISEDVKKQRKLISSIQDDATIRVMNGTNGKLFWISPVTGTMIDLPNYGSTEELSFRELKVMRNRSNSMLTQCSLIVLDKEVADALGLSRSYEGILEPSTLESTILDFEKIKSFLEKANKSFVNVLVSTAIRLYHEGKLHDARTIKLLEDKYNVYLEDTLPPDYYVSTY